MMRTVLQWTQDFGVAGSANVLDVESIVLFCFLGGDSGRCIEYSMQCKLFAQGLFAASHTGLCNLAYARVDTSISYS